MAHKNWDNVRDNRLYAYMNQAEMDAFLEAMRIRDMSQQATAVREFVVEQSQAIIINSRKQSNQKPQSDKTVKYQFSLGNLTVTLSKQ